MQPVRVAARLDDPLAGMRFFSPRLRCSNIGVRPQKDEAAAEPNGHGYERREPDPVNHPPLFTYANLPNLINIFHGEPPVRLICRSRECATRSGYQSSGR